ncbi:polysaccharide deacetylase family protein [Clostridiaceae bacterium OttesenSCG-928-D20]|nr:polysaccharide deacetylase family protein [Clostridiaceae bacterium OttesenSCG-928-D20]
MKKLIAIALGFVIAVGFCSPAFAANPPARTKMIAMTFDDGPHPTITPKLLDELSARNIKCTFFVLGERADLYPDLVERAHNEGHQIASHTYNHKDLSRQSDYTIKTEVNSTRELLKKLTGEDNFMVRVPFGAYNNRVLQYMNAPVILWDVDGTNGKYPTGEETLYKNTIKQAREGSIILLHDMNKENLNAGLRAIDKLVADGYTFVTVDELFRLNNVEPKDNKVYTRVDFAGTGYNEAALGNHWAYPSIQHVIRMGIMIGDGYSFNPNEYLTRAMAATILWNSAGKPLPSKSTSFLDISSKDWYFNAVVWAHENKVVSGYSKTEFAPHDYITREQFYVMAANMSEAMNLNLNTACPLRQYNDQGKVSSWADGAIKKIQRAGFVSENEASVFRPKDALSRAEAAELVSWLVSQPRQMQTLSSAAEEGRLNIFQLLMKIF